MSKNYNSFPCSYLQNGRLNEASADMEKIIEINPKWSAAHHKLEDVYQKQGHFDDAIAEYTRALEISPDLKEALISLEDTHQGGSIYSEEKRRGCICFKKVDKR